MSRISSERRFRDCEGHVIFAPQAKLLWHGERVKDWLLRGITYPVLFEIAPTGYCNASCPWCFFKDKRSSEKIDKTTVLRAIEDIMLIGGGAINWCGGGEPTLHPGFADFIELANYMGLKQGLFTNGYNEIPHQEKFDWIRISITDDISRIIKPQVPFGIVLNHLKAHTEKDVRHYCEWARDFGAKYFQVRPALVGDYMNQPIFPVPSSYLSDYNTDSFAVYVSRNKYVDSVRPREYPTCYGYHFTPSIDWRGRLCVCLYLSENDDYVLADLNQKRLIDAWLQIKKEVPVIGACQNCCKCHEINKILYAAKTVDDTVFI